MQMASLRCPLSDVNVAFAAGHVVFPIVLLCFEVTSSITDTLPIAKCHQTPLGTFTYHLAK